MRRVGEPGFTGLGPGKLAAWQDYASPGMEQFPVTEPVCCAHDAGGADELRPVASRVGAFAGRNRPWLTT